MRISVILVLEEGVAGGGAGWFDMVVATGNERSFRDGRGQGKVRTYVKDVKT